MALFTRKETGPLGVTTEEWDVDPVRLVGVAFALAIGRGVWEWVSSKISKTSSR